MRASSISTRQPNRVLAWTRSATPTPLAPVSVPPNSPDATSSCAFDVVLERIARGRPERSVILTGLRGVGKTVLLNALRSAAVRSGWGTGKFEARPDQGNPASNGGRPAPPRCASWLIRTRTRRWARSVRSSNATRGPRAKLAERWNPGIQVPPTPGRADSGDIEIDLVELFTDVGGLAADKGVGVAVCIDEMQDLRADGLSALCAACHEISQLGLPLIIVGAGAAASADGAQRVQELFRAALPLSAHRPPRPGGRRSRTAGPRRGRRRELRRGRAGGYVPGDQRLSYFIQAYGKVVWDLAPASPITADDIAVATPEAEAELAVGFFGSRYERATPAEREYLRAIAELADPASSTEFATSAVAEARPNPAVPVPRP